MNFGYFTDSVGVDFEVHKELNGKYTLINLSTNYILQDNCSENYLNKCYGSQLIGLDESYSYVVNYVYTSPCTCDFRGANCWLGCRCGSIKKEAYEKSC